ncbi:MAG: peptide chain release factor 1 [Thermosynechococcaceae cyanobacterium]
MRDLKLLPWRPLFNVAGVTVAIATLSDTLLGFLVLRSSVAQSIFGIIAAPAWALLTFAIASLWVGVLAVMVLERWFTHIRVSVPVLWALIACVALVLWVRSLFPIPGLLLGNIQSLSLIGLLLGVFWKGLRRWPWR